MHTTNVTTRPPAVYGGGEIFLCISGKEQTGPRRNFTYQPTDKRLNLESLDAVLIGRNQPGMDKGLKGLKGQGREEPMVKPFPIALVQGASDLHRPAGWLPFRPFSGV